MKTLAATVKVLSVPAMTEAQKLALALVDFGSFETSLEGLGLSAVQFRTATVPSFLS